MTLKRSSFGALSLFVLLMVSCGPSEETAGDDALGNQPPLEDQAVADLPDLDLRGDIEGIMPPVEPVCDLSCAPDEIFHEADCYCESLPEPASCEINHCGPNETIANPDSPDCFCAAMPPVDPDDDMVVLDPDRCVRIDTATGLAELDKNCVRSKGTFTLGLGHGGELEGAVQQAIYAPVAEVYITGSGLNNDGTPCPPEPTACDGGRGTYDPATGILTATLNITNGTQRCIGCVEEPCECKEDADCPLNENEEPGICAWFGRDMNCLAIQYLAEYMGAYGPDCADAGYVALGNSNAPPTSMPSTRVKVCDGCDPALGDCACKEDVDCPLDQAGNATLCIPSGQQSSNNNVFVIGSLPLGQTVTGLKIEILTTTDSYCPHQFVVVEEMAGNEEGFGCKTTCGDRIVSTNNGEVCEPFALGRCAGIRPLEVATQDCSRDFECVYAGVCANARDIVCVNNFQCPPDSSKLPPVLTMGQLLAQGIPHIPSEYRGTCEVSRNWGPCNIETDDPDIGCTMVVDDALNRKEICKCEIIGWYNPENVPNSLPITDPDVPGVCVGESIPDLVQLYMDAGCMNHAATTMENVRRKVLGLGPLPMPTTHCCQIGDINTGSFLPPETCCSRPACCGADLKGDANYPAGPPVDPTCPCGEPPLYQCP